MPASPTTPRSSGMGGASAPPVPKGVFYASAVPLTTHARSDLFSSPAVARRLAVAASSAAFSQDPRRRRPPPPPSKPDTVARSAGRSSRSPTRTEEEGFALPPDPTPTATIDLPLLLASPSPHASALTIPYRMGNDPPRTALLSTTVGPSWMPPPPPPPGPRVVPTNALTWTSGSSLSMPSRAERKQVLSRVAASTHPGGGGKQQHSPNGKGAGTQRGGPSRHPTTKEEEAEVEFNTVATNQPRVLFSGYAAVVGKHG